MYRRPSKRQIEARARKLEAMRRGKDRARMARPAQGRQPDLPNLRREVIVSKRAERVQSALCLKVGYRGRVARREQAKVPLSSAGHDLRNPFLMARAPSNAENAALAVASRTLYVLWVLRPIRFSQVANSIVSSVAVNVVNDDRWPYAMHVKPCESMSPVQRAVYVDFDVSTALADTASLPTDEVGTHARFDPSERPGIRAVVQEFAQTRGGKIGGSHDAVPSQSGQRPARVSALGGPRHFSRHIRVADGQPWKDRIGWSEALAKLRKAFLRVPGARSDFWRDQ